jgi:predicted O-methyltransferase YrrM
MATPLSYASKVQQNPQELQEFIEFVTAEKIKSYCEIGCKFGGLLWQVAQVLQPNARIVAVDMPNQAWGRSDSLESLQHCVDKLRVLGHDAWLFVGDSTSAGVVDRVKKLAPFDLLFIDANHTEPYVRKDFQNYGSLARIVCFHDIGWNNPTPPGRMAIEVPQFWQSLKNVYRESATFREIKHDKNHNGIGIMRWNEHQPPA